MLGEQPPNTYYRFIPSLREYVLVSQDESLIEIRSRDDSDRWISRQYRSGQTATLDSVGCSLEVDVVYREAKKNLPAPADA